MLMIEVLTLVIFSELESSGNCHLECLLVDDFADEVTNVSNGVGVLQNDAGMVEFVCVRLDAVFHVLNEPH